MTAIEACLDVAQHICASEGWGPPSTNADALVVLGRHRVLDADLARRLAQAVGFRNVLVHEYVTVDDAIVERRLDDLSDLDGFVTAVASGWTITADGAQRPRAERTSEVVLSGRFVSHRRDHGRRCAAAAR